MEQPHNRFEQDIVFAESIPAGPKQRYLAMTIDGLLTMILAGFVIGVMGLKKDDAGAALVVNFVVNTVYFVFPQWLYGITLGKKIMKIQLVALDGKLGFGQVLLRETVGRVVALFSVLGYLWLFFQSERRGWHDLMSGTRVVSTDPDAIGQSRREVVKFAVSTGVLTALSLGAVYFVLCTDWPIKQFAKKLELAGYEVSGAGGSLMRGIRLEKLSLSGTDSDFAIRKGFIRLDLFDLLKGKLVVRELSIGSGEMNLPDVSPGALVMGAMVGGSQKTNESPDAKEESQGNGERVEPAQVASHKKPSLKEVLLEKIDISNLVLNFGPSRKYTVERFLVDNVFVSQKNFKIDRIWLKSDIADLDLGTVDVVGKVIDAGRIKGSIKKTTFPTYLSGDLDFEGSFVLDLNTRKFAKLGFGMCGRRLQVRRDGEGFMVQSYDLTISKCLMSGMPLNRLNAQIRLMPPKYVPEVREAKVFVRDVEFKYMNNYGFVHTRGPKYFVFRTDSSLLMQLATGSEPVLTIASGLGEDREWLSQLYYDRNSIELTPEEMQVVVSDQKFFQSQQAQMLKAQEKMLGGAGASELPADLARDPAGQGGVPVTRDSK